MSDDGQRTLGALGAATDDVPAPPDPAPGWEQVREMAPTWTRWTDGDGTRVGAQFDRDADGWHVTRDGTVVSAVVYDDAETAGEAVRGLMRSIGKSADSSD